MRTYLAIALLSASCAFAQEKPAAGKEESASAGATAPRPDFRRDNASASQALFNRLDKNRDGYLTGTELTTAEALSANWIGVDRDGDGRISPAEFSAIESSGDVARK
jgi:Ca2+-binding EF-hand superfamily protein